MGGGRAVNENAVVATVCGNCVVPVAAAAAGNGSEKMDLYSGSGDTGREDTGTGDTERGDTGPSGAGSTVIAGPGWR